MRKIPITITEEELKLIIKNTKSKKHKAAFMLGFYEGMRISEVLNLNKGDVSNGFIHIKQSKGKKDRDIPLMDEVIHYLRYLPIGISRQALHKAIKKKGKEVLNKDIYFHTLRHSGATYYLNERNVDIRFIQTFLGHSRLDTTQIYTHINPVQLKNAFQNKSKSQFM